MPLVHGIQSCSCPFLIRLFPFGSWTPDCRSVLVRAFTSCRGNVIVVSNANTATWNIKKLGGRRAGTWLPDWLSFAVLAYRAVVAFDNSCLKKHLYKHVCTSIWLPTLIRNELSNSTRGNGLFFKPAGSTIPSKESFAMYAASPCSWLAPTLAVCCDG